MAPEDTRLYGVFKILLMSHCVEERKVMYSAMDRKYDTPGTIIIPPFCGYLQGMPADLMAKYTAACGNMTKKPKPYGPFDVIMHA